MPLLCSVIHMDMLIFVLVHSFASASTYSFCDDLPSLLPFPCSENNSFMVLVELLAS